MSQSFEAGTADAHDTPVDDRLEVEVRRNAGVAGVLAAASCALAIAYLVRAVGDGAPLAWLFGLLLGALGVSQLLALADGRAPLLIADDFGIRLRLGKEWRGLPWSALEQVVVEPRTSLIHDGRLVVAPRHLNRALEDLGPRARRQIAFNEKVYGAPLVVPLGLTTRLSTSDVVADLAQLAVGRATVVELAGYVAEPVVPETPERHARRERLRQREGGAGAGPVVAVGTIGARGEPVEAHELRGLRLLESLRTPARGAQLIARVVSRLGQGRTHEVDASPEREATVRVFDPVPVLRDTRPASRIEAHLEGPATLGNLALRLDPSETADGTAGLPEDGELRRPGLSAEGEWDAVIPIARPGLVVEPLVIDDFATEPAIVPVIGPRVAAARTRLGFDVEALSTRTRIRPHVIEAIEVDDFEPCGGDFYARGHLRSLARVLGLPADELAEQFDARYASAPINARKVFEAELATGVSGGFRSSFGGPRWSLMIGTVLVLVLAWSMARLFTGDAQTATSPAPSLAGPAGPAYGQAPITSALGKPVRMTVKSSRGASDIQVRDRSGRILFGGHLKAGGQTQLFGTGPFTVRASNPGAVDVWVAGKPRGSVGVGDQPGRRTLR